MLKPLSDRVVLKMVEAEEEMEPKENDKETIETFEDMMEWLQKEMEKQK